MKILVLGSSGVIGSAVTKFLRARGDTVIEWDIALSPDHDLRVHGILEETLRDGVDFVLFFAFDVGGSKYPVQSAEYVSNNMRILHNTFEALSKFKVPFIHTTSQMSNMDHNPYGPLKRVGEFYTEYLGGVNVKVWNVYGPEEIGAKSHAVTDFIHQAKTMKKIEMLTNGQELRQFLHADDFARAIGVIMNKYDEFSGRMVDVSSFKWVSILDVARTVAKVCDAHVIPGRAYSSFQTKTNVPSEDFLKTGWTPSISLEDGIRMIAGISENNHLETILSQVVHGKGDSDKHSLTLFGIAMSLGAKNILELGVRSGNTTLPLLLAAHMNKGKLTSVDIETTEFTPPCDMTSSWEFVRSDALDFLKSRPNPPYDLIYIDDWHSYRHVKSELEYIDTLVSPKTVILLHDLMYGNTEPRYHSDLTLKDGQWAEGGPYRAVAELNSQFWEFSTIPVNNGLTILRKKYSSKYYT